MIFSTEASASRQVLGRVYRGTNLHDALTEVVQTHNLRTAWFTGLGAFEWIEVTEYCQDSKKYEASHRFERCELLSMVGNLSERDGAPFWHLHAAVSRREDGNEVVYGGHVTDGQVFALEFRIECFDALGLRRTDDEGTGLQLWAKEGLSGVSATADSVDAAVSTGVAVASEAVTWAMAAEQSAQTHAPKTDYKPARGEYLQHPKFGLCKIEGLSGDGVCIIKLPDARRKKIKLNAMEVLAPREDGTKRIYPVQSRAR